MLITTRKGFFRKIKMIMRTNKKTGGDSNKTVLEVRVQPEKPIRISVEPGREITSVPKIDNVLVISGAEEYIIGKTDTTLMIITYADGRLIEAIRTLTRNGIKSEYSHVRYIGPKDKAFPKYQGMLKKAGITNS